MAIEPISRATAQRGSVRVTGNWIDAALRINDADGASFLRSKDDDSRLDASETALRVGLRALASADHAYTERLLDEKLGAIVGELSRTAEAMLQKASDAFEERWRKRIDEDLAARLEAHRKQLDEQLQAALGDSSDKSIQQAVRRFLGEYNAVVVRELGEDHARMRKDLAELVNGAAHPDHPIAKINSQLADLRKDLAVELEAARAATTAQAVRKASALGGFDYQTLVHQEIAALLQGGEDLVELKGRAPGATGGAEGDIVVTIDPRLTAGVVARVAIEATKQAAGLTISKLRAMLQKAMTDRDAQAAVVVIRGDKILGGQRIQFIPGLGAVAVFEPDDPPEFRSLPVLLAIKHARLVAIRQARPLMPERDEQRIEHAVQKAKEAVDLVESILGNLEKMVKLAEATSSTAKELRRRVVDAISEIDEALGN